MVRIKGANASDKKVIDTARALAPKKKVTRTTRNEETAEAKPTVAAKKVAAERQFDQADMAAQETLAETQARMAARGF
ncbi:MAG: hypothetical protein V4696_10160 [Pseudomonadota bacterium]